MQSQRLRTILGTQDQEVPGEARAWLKQLGVSDVRTGHSNLVRLADAGVTLDLLAEVCRQFEETAPRLADVDMALNNLERFLLAARSPLSTAALFERDRQALPNLLLLLTASQDLSDLLCSDPESYDLLRMTEGLPYARETIVGELVAEVASLDTNDDVMAHLRRFKRRETLRIAYGDVVAEHPVDQVTRQISYVADAVVEAALQHVHRKLQGKVGRERPQFVVLALGKLGGRELNYSSDIDLVFLHDSVADGTLGADQYAHRVAQQLIQLLTEPTDLGAAYRVDMRLRPEGRRGPLSTGLGQALAYYDLRGRTWERQAYVKARVIAGDIELGERFLGQLEPWVYRRYLSLADIAGIQSLKRRIEKRADAKGVANTNVKTGHGGIRDIEFVIQFLQLLNGGASPEVRTGNTLEAISLLEQAGCLTEQERSILDVNYRFLRKVEHRLQIMFDLQTHELPTSSEEMRKLSRRLGYSRQSDHGSDQSAKRLFQEDYEQRTAENNRILDHLLHDAFEEATVDSPQQSREVDLVNDPDPSEQAIEEILGHYPFSDPRTAYDHLMSLATESIPFLSTRRCRLFLASIAPRLLSAIAATPDPDATLIALCRVSDSLGGKAALWELFSENRPSMNLYVTLCAACPYLTGILTTNPGMIDELTDSLLTDRLPDYDRLHKSLEELAHSAEDLAPILHSFKASQHLRIGVRDILGKDAIQATHQALSDTAEVCLKKVIEIEYEKLVEKLGEPQIGSELPGESGIERITSEILPWSVPVERHGTTCEFLVVAIGKLGGSEPNFHSDLDLVFLYEAEGDTQPVQRGGHDHRNSGTTNNHFFGELAQRIIKKVNQFGPQGQLYEVDPRLRPTGRGGQLAVSLESFVKYFDRGEGQLWERQALCKARVITGSEIARTRCEAALQQAVFGQAWQENQVGEIRQMRAKLEASASPRNLKRARGGTMDTEFIVQMLQLKHGCQELSIRQTNTLKALDALASAGLLKQETAEQLAGSYRFQRNVESRIRLMNSPGRHEFPEDEKELARLAMLLGYENTESLTAEAEKVFRQTRAVFDAFFPA
ncbi:[protein-PII] uridylyltransferase family protein [Adhaeretor mobilis]|uniref:Glutamate-ammonia-ligase adenylyltransferase n=1 Tax=Adhaeretor mobilis TaxID=1930276 RepID=A0A517N1R3_9BACT|nr:bifunctional [glutamate--ammonia ligase]-adenylyl-L-tyrosine phosphorylase/[glutamate--ammonia-ligase] adenylyltransferase [Adhaeretor mobilis]QDT01063.1 Glutamate-ammonia-ligase adenylyltransferase [Adhaeretor mobilis]